MTEPLMLFGPDAPRDTVYVMTDMRYLKIGFTTRAVRKRGGELRAFDLFSFDAPQSEERRLHERFKRYRIGDSEWYRPEGELLVWVVVRVCQEANPRACALLWKALRNYYRPPGDALAA